MDGIVRNFQEIYFCPIAVVSNISVQFWQELRELL